VTRAIGIDPGTVSFDVCGRDGDEVFLDATYLTADVRDAPESLVEVLCAAGPVDLVVGPSGYGLPWTDVRDLGPEELDLLLLADAGDGSRGTIVGGMGRLLEALKESGLPVCIAPGVLQLTTVPEHRKANRIDMGTADKLCTVALAVWDQARRLDVPYDETSFVSVEAGGAFTAVVAVERGAIVDGSGGTCGAMGFRALGAMDGELAYLLRDFSKDILASGGAAWIAGAPGCSPDDLVAAAASDHRAAVALAALLEDVAKRVAAESILLEAPREILLSGRLAHVPELRRRLVNALSRFAPVHAVGGYARVCSEAAQGAALVGQGLAGDRGLSDLVDAMGLRSARGCVLDHLFVSEAESLRRRHPLPRRPQVPFWERS
jgi:Predicted butyrate kinase